MRAPRLAVPALLLPFLFAGCSGSGEPASGVIHLDLRLADGASPAAALGAFGHAPLAEERTSDDGGTHGDSGLRAVGRLARRAWPADVDVPLHASVASVPRAAVLTASVAGLDVAGDSLFAAVDVRRPGETWRALAELEVPARAERWQPLRGDLGEYGGERIELRFRAHLRRPAEMPGDVPDEATGAAPRTESVLWGTPEVVGDQPASRRPNLVLITLDTTRADALATGDSAFAPFLTELAGESIVFTDAWAASNATSPSHATLLTGLHVEEHGVLSNRHLLAPEVDTIAETLRAAGYHTAAAVSVPHIQAGTGFGQGFDEFVLAAPGAEVDGAMAVDAVEQLLDEWSALPPRPFFLWVHLFDPHTPYTPPDAFVAEFLARTGLERPPSRVEPATIPVLHDASTGEDVTPWSSWSGDVTSLEAMRFSYHLGVAYADHLCERVHAALRRAELLDETALLLTADHGESLGEHGIWFEHGGVFRETLAVPLFLRLPGPPGGLGGSDARTARIEARVTGVDVVPTLLALAGLPQPADLPGIDLVALARGGAGATPDRRVWFALSRMDQAGFRDGETHFITTLTDRVRYGTSLRIEDGRAVPRLGAVIPAGTHFLFDPALDPALARDLAAERPAEAAASLATLEEWRASLERRRGEQRNVTAAEEEGLRHMGYAGD